MEILAEVLIVLERPTSFLVEPSQATFELMMSILPGEELLKEENNRISSNLIVSHSVEILNKENSSVGTTGYSSEKKLLL